MNNRIFLMTMSVAMILFFFDSDIFCQQNDSILNNLKCKNSISIRPIDLFVSLYTLEYERQLDYKNEILFGLYYFMTNSNSKYPGYYKLYSPMFGYKRYLWKGLHIEYILLPGFAKYDDNNQSKNYNSFEIYNEIHIGYRFEFKIFEVPLFVTPKELIGFGLYRSNQPNSFKLIDNKPENFIPNKLYPYPNINIGIRF